MKNVSIEKLFIILGFIFGCLFIYIIPPFQSPDEDSHFKKAYSISKGEFYQIQKKNVVGLNIPDEMNNYIYEKLGWANNRDKKYDYKSLYYDQFLGQDLSKKTLVSVSTDNITPVAHLIPATGILVSYITSPVFVGGAPSTPYMLSFARFASLLFFLTIGYLAIKITPAFKKSMFSILLLPMPLYLGSMVTYDSLILGSVILAVALMLKLIYDNKFKFDKKMFIIFSIIGYILLNIKIVYFPILFLLIFIPNNKFKDNKKWLCYIKLVSVVIAFTLLLKIPNYFINTPGSDLSSKQISYILSNPIDFIKIMFNNIFNQLRIQIQWMVGTFGLLDTYLPPIFILIALVNLFIVFITEAILEKIKITNKMKIVCLIYVVFAVGAMYAAMYIGWTPQVTGIIGGKDITGVQGRYYIPLLISLPLLFSNKKISEKSKIFSFSKDYFNTSVFITITLLCVSLIVCLTRYWI